MFLLGVLNAFLLFVSYLFLVVCVLVGVAFLTLLERVALGYIQIRKGPNVLGDLQPFSDAIKLFTKEIVSPIMANYTFYYLCPIMSLVLALFLWMVIPIFSLILDMSLGLLFFMCVSSMSVYSVMGAGWSSNSKYALLGSIRAAAQTISYEVSMALILLCVVILTESYNLMDYKDIQKYSWFVFISFPLMMMWLITMLAETNRTPFDLAEAESELVSGFNIEYSSGGFALIFMAEYGNILLMSMMMTILFFGSNYESIMFMLIVCFFSFVFIWVRGMLPRMRYDKLMNLAWKKLLPVSLNYFLMFLGLKIFIDVMFNY
uniref:NADH-ubiquinone oxidoreductase chain 1 n=1 Tax=Scutigera coleoptrata TaxID=29022 RepID=Q70XR9_SCUCO|nr:NADH dehydrogenase subunit 1 [Scutigera coleoptrata]CAE01480.1 NADH dehydrogenase subunit 1 [Scutigera coleoptrata]